MPLSPLQLVSVTLRAPSARSVTPTEGSVAAAPTCSAVAVNSVRRGPTASGLEDANVSAGSNCKETKSSNEKFIAFSLYCLYAIMSLTLCDALTMSW